MRKALLLITLLIGSFPLVAQEEESVHVPRNQKFHYFNYVQSGVLIGKKGYGTTASFSTVHGVRLNKFAFGLGIGYDDYARSASKFSNYGSGSIHWKSVPVFAALGFDFIQSKSSALFLQINTGYSFIKARKYEDFNIASDIDGGLMINPSLGFRLRSGNTSIYVSAGYKVQRNAYQYDPYPWIWGYPTYKVLAKETMERFEARIGFGWR